MVGDSIATSDDYLVTLSELSLEVPSLEVVMDAGGAAEAFDPASPPTGYSLCHNGHCHADDGALVSYDDVTAELGASAGRATAVFPISPGPDWAIDGWRVCPEGCDLDRGTITALRAGVTGLRLVAHVDDRRSGPDRRLPDGGIDLDLDLALDQRVIAAFSAVVGPHEELHVDIEGHITVVGALFDDVRWGDVDLAGVDLADRVGESVEFVAWRMVGD